MPNTFFASDHHFGHQGMLTFTRADGVTPVRNFSTVEEMNEHMIQRHNSVVGKKDTCWFLGDVVINRRFLKTIIPRLNGRLRLVLGNHDIFKNKDYYEAGFEDLHAFRKFDGFVCTHVPVHRESLRSSWGKNVHGHLHTNRVMKPYGYDKKLDKLKMSNHIDPNYYCVCVEQLDNYTPVSIDELRENLNATTNCK